MKIEIAKTIVAAFAACTAGLAAAQEAPSAGRDTKVITTVQETKISNGERFFCRQANIEELLETNNWKMEPCNEWADDTGQITLNGRHKMVIDITGRIGGMRVTRIQWSAKHQ